MVFARTPVWPYSILRWLLAEIFFSRTPEKSFYQSEAAASSSLSRIEEWGPVPAAPSNLPLPEAPTATRHDPGTNDRPGALNSVFPTRRRGRQARNPTHSLRDDNNGPSPYPPRHAATPPENFDLSKRDARTSAPDNI